MNEIASAVTRPQRGLAASSARLRCRLVARAAASFIALFAVACSEDSATPRSPAGASGASGAAGASAAGAGGGAASSTPDELGVKVDARLQPDGTFTLYGNALGQGGIEEIDFAIQNRGTSSIRWEVVEQPASDLFALKAQWFPEEKNAAASPVAPGQDSARAHLTFVAEKAPCEIGTKLREARVTFRITETDGAKRTADLPLVVKIVEAFHPLLITGTEVTIGPDGWGQVQVVNPNPVALPYYHAVMECADDCRRKPGESGSFSDYISYAGPALGKDGFPPGESALSFQTVSPSQLPAANCSCIARFFAATYLEHCPSNEQEVKVTLKR